MGELHDKMNMGETIKIVSPRYVRIKNRFFDIGGGRIYRRVAVKDPINLFPREKQIKLK